MCIQIPAESVIFATNVNPSSHIRGLSPFVTGVNAATVSYQALRYMKDFYTNNAVPSHIISLQANLSPKQRQDWTEKYLEQFSAYNNQSQKVIVSSGTDLKFEKIDDEQKTGEKINLLRYSDEQIAMLFSVPPTIMGMFDKVRFETATIERTMFLEDAVLPLIEVIQDTFQHYIVDRYYGLNPEVARKSLPMTKSFRNRLDKSFNTYSAGDSDVIVVMDPDQIPLMAQVNIDKFNAIASICQNGMMSVNEAAEYLHVEIPYNPIRDKIFIPSNVVDANVIEPDTGVLPVSDQADDEVEGDTEHSNDPNQRTMGEVKQDEKLDNEKSQKVKSLNKVFRSIRKQTLQNNEHGKIYTLKEIDDICRPLYGDIPQLKKELRKDLFKLKSITKDLPLAERERAIKDYYNTTKKISILRRMI
jgi:hypothetical protein